jgi:hypothetical protein
MQNISFIPEQQNIRVHALQGRFESIRSLWRSQRDVRYPRRGSGLNMAEGKIELWLVIA